MSKNFNNNTNNNDNSINLQIASLNTNLLTNYPTNSTISSLMASTVQTQTTLRDTAISVALASANLFTSNSLLNYMTSSLINTLLLNTITAQSSLRDTAIATALASANAFTNTSLSNYTNTIAMNSLINTNILNQQTLTAANLNYAINTNNTVYLANLLSNYSSTTLTNLAISTAINLNNTSNISYTNSKIITEIARADLALSNAIIANNLLYTVTSNIGVGSQFNSTSIGQATKTLSGFSVLIGNNSATSNYGIAVGYNSGQNCNINNSSCSFFGSNSGITAGSSYINSTAIGSGALITSSYQTVIGDSITTTYSANVTTPNLTSTTHNVNLQIISYNTIPLFLSQKYIGFMTSSLSLKTISAFNNYLNLASISIIPGVFLIQFQINYNYSIGNMLSWWSFGVGTLATNLETQACKSYCSSSTNLPFSVSNSYMFTSNISQTIYLNSFISDFDNTTITLANLSNFSISAKLTVCRIA